VGDDRDVANVVATRWRSLNHDTLLLGTVVGLSSASVDPRL
jgi:hypothetical protein